LKKTLFLCIIRPIIWKVLLTGGTFFFLSKKMNEPEITEVAIGKESDGKVETFSHPSIFLKKG